MDKITVLVADGHRLFAECLVGMLGRFEDLWVLEELPATASAAVDAAQALTPDVVLIDQWLPGADATVVVKKILAKAPGMKVLVLSWFHGPDQVQSALSAGAKGFLPKAISLDMLISAIRAAFRDDTPVYVDETVKLVEHLTAKADENAEIAKRFSRLTPREVEILKVLAHGEPIDEVADRLSISRHTLKTHIRNILAKTGARSHAEAAGLALRCGLIQI